MDIDCRGMECSRKRAAVGPWLAAALTAMIGCGTLGCGSAGSKPSYDVAYSTIGDSSDWFEAFSDQMGAESGNRGHGFFLRRADFNNDDQIHEASQIENVRELIGLRPDVLVLGPVAVNRALKAVQIANDANVPVIIVNRDVEDPVPASSDKYFATVHSDFEAFGREVCGKQLRKKFGDAPIRLLHLKGTEGGSNTIGMDKGCKDAIRADGHMEIVCEDHGNYDEPQSYEATKRQIAAGCKFNAVFGHGDTEGIGAVRALLEAAQTDPRWKPGTDLSKGEIIVTACDASKKSLANVKAGLEYGVMTTSPYYASQVFDAIEKHMAGQKVDAFIPVTDFFIDVTNIAQYESFGF